MGALRSHGYVSGRYHAEKVDMPIYEYDCPVHGRIELLERISDADKPFIYCMTCGIKAARVYSVCTMKPDSNWHFGQYIPKHGYINSASKIARIKRESNIVTLDNQNDVDAMKKTATEARKDWDAQVERQNRKVFEETIANSGVVNSFGELTEDARKPL